MKFEKAKISFLPVLCQWLSDQENWKICGGEGNPSWLYVLQMSTVIIFMPDFYVIVKDGEKIGFLLVENSIVHTFLAPEYRQGNGREMFKSVLKFVSTDLGINPVYTAAEGATMKWLIWSKLMKDTGKKKYNRKLLVFGEN